LVVPKVHKSSIAERYTAQNSGVIAHIFEVIAYLRRKSYRFDEGYRVVANCGEIAGQSVFHVHFHVLAKRPLAWPPG
jgi:histidine triad (HIT) family protein